jgi:hypothetical protein
MAKVHEFITDEIAAFIGRQHMFFVGTAPLASDGHVNLSPKGLDCFRVLSRHRVGYMDVIGSGNETAAHLLENGRITFMFCAFDGPPNILRLYGTGRAILPADAAWADLAPHFPIYPSTRQIIVADIARVQTSCGFGVPEYTYAGDRDMHFRWAAKNTPAELEEYQRKHNQESIDGLAAPQGVASGSTLRNL